MSAVPRCFVDTNILLYSIDKAAPEKRRQAVVWLDRLWLHMAGRLSWQILQEFYFNGIRKMGATPAKLRRVVEMYMEWRPTAMNRSLMERAWYWMDQAQVSYWDSFVLSAAERTGCEILLSEDFQHDQWFDKIRVINPFQSGPEKHGLPAR